MCRQLRHEIADLRHELANVQARLAERDKDFIGIADTIVAGLVTRCRPGSRRRSRRG